MIPPEILERARQWRRELEAAGPDRAQTFWRVGCKAAQTLAELPGTVGRTKAMAELAAEAGQPLTSFYNLVNVGIVFRDGLLPQSWTWHVRQARLLIRLSEAERAAQLEGLRTLGPGQSAAGIPSRRELRQLESEGHKAYRLALDRFGALGNEARLLFIRRCLESLDVFTVRFPHAAELAEEICQAARRVKELAISSAAPPSQESQP